MAAALDALAAAYGAERHGSRLGPHALCTALLKETGRSHAVVREAVRRVRQA